MLKRPGVIFSKYSGIILSLIFFLTLPGYANAISLGNLTFSMRADSTYVSKKVVNNNKTPRLYQVSVAEIDRPGGREIKRRPEDGELLFAPRQLTLQAGESEYFKFYYHGPEDSSERYYRISFKEIPTLNHIAKNLRGDAISLEPIVIMDTILVVRPRNINFKWDYQKASGLLKNTGNTWFKLLVKPGCGTKEEDGEAWYLRPGEFIKNKVLTEPGEIYLIYDNRFIKIADPCSK
ncbi:MULTISPECIES: fimbria/pilus periplasmic chaperone [Enterobacter]|jgi:P pilus assembly chaperone PapD|uniref:fimbria/pilus periplasmic chaperone n=1 Tax=Enterobacter TaxID=547 RepID=UPI00163977F0|nr:MULTISPECIES: fimbria/pilus periplasmic chaperone [Enterobacter]MBK1520859.1 fimbria/pilus periplasmic chaperone [Enterobacter ludwigii]MDR6368568.1 P pilus assembly chaperone PapD [Enterobacter sp. SORGH_AS_0287]